MSKKSKTKKSAEPEAPTLTYYHTVGPITRSVSASGTIDDGSEPEPGTLNDGSYGLNLKPLIGRTILGISLNPDDTRLRFETKQGDLVYYVWGDCCSQSWFADIVGVSRLVGHAVVAAEEVDMPTPTDERERSDCDVQYGVKLTTTAGYVDIVYRNASNGYYGGSIEGPVDDVVSEWRSITEDHSA